MQDYYSKKFANLQQNSLIQESCTIQGKLKKKLPFKDRSTKAEINSYIPVDGTHSVICSEDIVFLISLANGQIISEQRKLHRSPVVVMNDHTICYGNGFLFRQKVSDFAERKTSWIIPGYPGEWSTFDYLFPFDRFFIAGVTALPFPKDDRRHTLELGCRLFENGSKKIWSREFDKPVPPPPACTVDGNLIMYHNGSLLSISTIDGTIQKEKQIDTKILSCSIGPNNHCYSFGTKDSTRYLTEWDEHFGEVSSVEIPSIKFHQPPVTLPDGTVLLIGETLAAAYRNGQQQWVVAQTGGDKSPFLATATVNNRVLLIDGTKLICLDENGKTLWNYTKEDPSPFRTQPVIGKDGSVYVADNDALYVVSDH